MTVTFVGANTTWEPPTKINTLQLSKERKNEEDNNLPSEKTILLPEAESCHAHLIEVVDELVCSVEPRHCHHLQENSDQQAGGATFVKYCKHENAGVSAHRHPCEKQNKKDLLST